MKIVHMIAFAILVIGGLNVGISAFGYDIIALVLGVGGTALYIAHILIGLSAITLVATHKGSCKTCVPGPVSMA